MKEQSWNPVLNKILRLKDIVSKINPEKNYSDKTQIKDFINSMNNSPVQYFDRENIIEYWVNIIESFKPDSEEAKEFRAFLDVLKINQWNNYVLFHYVSFAEVKEDTKEQLETGNEQHFWNFQDRILRECRSVVIDVLNDEVALSPYKKFFNVGQLEEVSLDYIKEKINNAKTIEFTNKLDGSMQQARWYNNRVLMSGSQAIDPDNSWRLKDGYNRLLSDAHYIKMLQDNPDNTYIFEYIDMRDKHIVCYKPEQEGLYLIGIRNSITGKEATYREVLSEAKKYNIKTTQQIDTNLNKIISSLSEVSASEAEGFVINIDDLRVKLKYDDYCRLHSFLASALSANRIVQYIVDDMTDDVRSKLPQEYQIEFDEKVSEILKMKQIILNYIDSIYETAPANLNRKDFFLWLNESDIPKCYRKYISNKYLNKSYDILSYHGTKPVIAMPIKKLKATIDIGEEYIKQHELTNDEIEL